MLDRRNFLLTTGMTVAVGMLNGCATDALLKDHQYTEQVSSLLISQDKRHLVFLGKDYHYVFDAPDLLLATLQSPFHQYVVASTLSFHVNPDGITPWTVELFLNKLAPDFAKQAALDAGFKQVEARNRSFSCRASVKMLGKRYAAGAFDAGDKQALNRTYTVYVVAEQSHAEHAGKLMLTPITATVDGALVIAGIPLIAIVAGMFVTCHGDHGDSRCN